MGLLATLLTASASQASGGSVVVWHWDRDFPGCGLLQNVDEDTALEIGRTPGNNDTWLIIKPLKPFSGSEKTLNGGTLSFQPTGPVDADITIQEGAGRRRVIYAYSHDPEFMAKFSGASEVSVSHDELAPTKATLQAAAAVVPAMRACEDAKMRDWSIDPVAWRSLAVKPVPITQPWNWRDWLDYPEREKIYKNDIDVVARLDLSADGSVQGCTVVNKPPAEFVTATCKALKRNARLKAARDASGAGVPAPYVITVSFGPIPL